ncbi:hypothetical protein [Streptomyces sp. NPDC006193]|uniref:LppU/SCO3897 family protein n=1 Tax=Streptomyces sp. NPDC006193 TaxID=3155717 RepID=UPI0033B5345A
MSTPPPHRPAHPQLPGPYAQPSGPYPQPPGPYAQAPGPYPQPPGPYAQSPGPYPQPPGPYAQAPHQPYPPAHAFPQPQQYSGGGAAPAAACQLCGASPAAYVTVRGHQGMLVIMRFLRRQGWMCRTCALATFREMQSDTLVQGWWGALSAFITPVTLLTNLGALSAIRRMPAPVTPGTRPPLDPGKPVFKRPAGMLAAIPLGLFCLAVLVVPAVILISLLVDSGGSEQPALKAGSCAHNDAAWPEQKLRPVDCGSPDAAFRVLDPDSASCAPGDYTTYPLYGADGSRSLCLHPLKSAGA